MKIKNLNKIFRVLCKFRYYKNWKDIILAYARNNNPTKVVLKNGVTICAPETNSILRGVKRVFFKKAYNRTNCEIVENKLFLVFNLIINYLLVVDKLFKL